MPSAQAMFRAVGADAPDQVHHAKGCETCGETGYAGRQGVFEIVEITDEVAARIGDGASEQQLRAVAVSAGNTLMAQGLHLVVEGRTSVEEVRRVLGDQ